MTEKAADWAHAGRVGARAPVVARCYRLLLMLCGISALLSLDTRDTMEGPIDVHVPDSRRE